MNLKFASPLAIAVALSTGIPALHAETPSDTFVIVREISSIAEWDPAVSQILDVALINGDVYDSLVGFDPRNPDTLGGMLAESWSVSEDGMTITFKMREGVTFHSGNPVTSADPLFSFRRLMLIGREPSSNMRALGYSAENIDDYLSAPDPQTFVMKLPNKLAPTMVINMLTSSAFSVVDSELVKSHEVDGDFGAKWLSGRADGEASAGSGPFMIDTFRPQSLVMLSANEDYWRFKPAMKRVIYRHVPEAGTQRLLIEKGDADLAFNITATDAAAMAGAEGVKVEYRPSKKILYFGFNRMIEPFDDPRVVKAMRYLVDYEGLSNSIMKDIGTVHQTFVPAGFLGAVTETPFSLAVEKAKALLAEAGYPDGFEFTFTAYNRKPEMDLATSFQATAAQAGVKVDVVNAPVSQTIPLYRDQKLQALQLSYTAGYLDPNATASKFTFNPGAMPGADREAKWPSEMTYRLGWYPEDLSEKTAAAAQELDETKRTKMYEELQKAAWEDSPFVFLFQATQQLAMRDNVEGVFYDTRGSSFASVTKK
ncbi:peptide ABC transporter substrate-binding protein [Primorskyibacter flagellatus]|uniref:Peptide ABC transporter substrate-binding protein n=1 Tax=Primorskyibacter flagellatus TaxID=1387277 RepID=A0A917EL24_9RHOB|nr:ABC transporter substrate-binding protein [Primorskyibacter flagellatus]GGE50256.1 peptide ABC transporter substrate-binding protein [Primorskyibacter flagellatus]